MKKKRRWKLGAGFILFIYLFTFESDSPEWKWRMRVSCLAARLMRRLEKICSYLFKIIGNDCNDFYRGKVTTLPLTQHPLLAWHCNCVALVACPGTLWLLAWPSYSSSSSAITTASSAVCLVPSTITDKYTSVSWVASYCMVRGLITQRCWAGNQSDVILHQDCRCMTFIIHKVA